MDKKKNLDERLNQAYANSAQPGIASKKKSLPKLEKRNLLRAVDIPHGGVRLKVVELRQSESGFFKWDLIVDDAGITSVIGLQNSGFNMNQLIDLLGDDPNGWPGKELHAIATKWNDQDVIRFLGPA